MIKILLTWIRKRQTKRGQARELAYLQTLQAERDFLH
jgi:hypothetical protein